MTGRGRALSAVWQESDADVLVHMDVELLVIAERGGLRIHEVPVDWVDDPDSRVDIVATAVADLKGVARMRRTLRDGTVPVLEVRERLGRRTARELQPVA